jgi:hypothetical protein
MNTVSDLYALTNGPAPLEMSFASAMAHAAHAAIVVGGALATIVTVIEARLVARVQKRESLFQWLRSRVPSRIASRLLVARADAKPR